MHFNHIPTNKWMAGWEREWRCGGVAHRAKPIINVRSVASGMAAVIRLTIYFSWDGPTSKHLKSLLCRGQNVLLIHTQWGQLQHQSALSLILCVMVSVQVASLHTVSSLLLFNFVCQFNANGIAQPNHVTSSLQFASFVVCVYLCASLWIPRQRMTTMISHWRECVCVYANGLRSVFVQYELWIGSQYLNNP